MNELSNLAERLGADIEKVRIGMGSDPRIGYHFIYPGCGYGGSCFPKDVQALERTATEIGYDATLLQAVEAVNAKQKRVLSNKISFHYKGDIKGKVFALWGLSFKPNTDDMREAPARVLMDYLWENGASVQAYDPEALEEARHLYPNQANLTLCDSPEDALKGCDALVVVTEWNVFRSPSFELLKKEVADTVIFDGRNLYDPEMVANEGFAYYAIGRGKRAVAD